MNLVNRFFRLYLIMVFAIATISCEKDDDSIPQPAGKAATDKTIAVPSLTTLSVTFVTSSGATTGGNITAENGTPVTARGIIWGTETGPTIDLASKSLYGVGTGLFSSKLSGLQANTKYYVRAFATNSKGTAYGNEVSFTTDK